MRPAGGDAAGAYVLDDVSRVTGTADLRSLGASLAWRGDAVAIGAPDGTEVGWVGVFATP